jgi:hypothetical protein
MGGATGTANASQYVTCFSERPDDLSQWRGYVHSPVGFAIGFDPKALREAAPEAKYRLEKCEYGIDAQRAFIDELICEALASAKADEELAVDPWPIGFPARYYGKHFTRRCESLAQKASTFKAPVFFAEKEYRAICNIGNSADGVKFRQSGSLLVPYVEWKIPNAEHEDTPIKHLIVAPGPHKDDVVSATKRMLRKTRVQVTGSELPFRNW